MDFLLTAKRDLDAAKRFFRMMLEDEPLLPPTGSAPMGPVPIRPPSRQPGKTGSARRSTMSPSTCSVKLGPPRPILRPTPEFATRPRIGDGQPRPAREDPPT